MLDEREFELKKSDIVDYKIKYIKENRIQLNFWKTTVRTTKLSAALVPRVAST